MVQMSQEFFENPGSYADFTSMMLGCMDPRDMVGIVPGEYPVIRQTAGGAVGEGFDSAIAMTAIEGKLVTPPDAMRADRGLRLDTLLLAHYRCALDAAAHKVTAEIASPSPFTADSVDRLGRTLGQDDVLRSTDRSVTDAAKRELEYLEEHEPMGSLAEHAEEVVHVHGENIAEVYAVNLHPAMGLNPNAKPRDAEGVSLVQAYHDGVAATVEALRAETQLTNEARGLRLASMLRRSAATQTVITEGRPDMTLLEVHPVPDAPGGLQVIEREAA